MVETSVSKYSNETAVSLLYFDTDVSTIKPRESSNKIKIDFPTSLTKNSVLIETESEENFLSCEYFVQIGAYGNKKYAYEAKDILNEIELITINEIYSSSKPRFGTTIYFINGNELNFI